MRNIKWSYVLGTSLDMIIDFVICLAFSFGIVEAALGEGAGAITAGGIALWLVFYLMRGTKRLRTWIDIST